MPTANMGLDLPVPMVTTGSDWATKLIAALTALDAHTHAPGAGALIPATGLAGSIPASKLETGLVDTQRISVQRLVAAATSVTFSGLTGDTDDAYEIECTIKCGGSGAVAITFNGGAGTVRYLMAYTQGTTTPYTGAAVTSLTNAGTASCTIHLSARAHDGVIRVGHFSGASCDSAGVFTDHMNGSFTWNDGGTQTAQITSITLTSSVASGFAIGSEFVIRRKKRS